MKQKILNKTVVDPSTGCWNWVGSRDLHGYGRIRIKNKVYKAHRISYKIFKSDFDESLCVCHSCDNPSCVNPDHLWQGTIADNNHDKFIKGRAPKTMGIRGSKHANAKYSEDTIRYIKFSDKKASVLSKELGIGIKYISAIKLNTRWAHII